MNFGYSLSAAPSVQQCRKRMLQSLRLLGFFAETDTLSPFWGARSSVLAILFPTTFLLTKRAARIRILLEIVSTVRPGRCPPQVLKIHGSLSLFHFSFPFVMPPALCRVLLCFGWVGIFFGLDASSYTGALQELMVPSASALRGQKCTP